MKPITLALLTITLLVGTGLTPVTAEASTITVAVTCSAGQGTRWINGVPAHRGDTVTFTYSGCGWVEFPGGVLPTGPGLNNDSAGNVIPKSGTLTVSIAPLQPGETCCEVDIIAIFAPSPSGPDSRDATFVGTGPGNGAPPAPAATAQSGMQLAEGGIIDTTLHGQFIHWDFTKWVANAYVVRVSRPDINSVTVTLTNPDGMSLGSVSSSVAESDNTFYPGFPVKAYTDMGDPMIHGQWRITVEGFDGTGASVDRFDFPLQVRDPSQATTPRLLSFTAPKRVKWHAPGAGYAPWGEVPFVLEFDDPDHVLGSVTVWGKTPGKPTSSNWFPHVDVTRTGDTIRMTDTVPLRNIEGCAKLFLRADDLQPATLDGGQKRFGVNKVGGLPASRKICVTRH